MASPSKPDPCDEQSLAERLLAALDKGDVDGAQLIQGEILGLHFAKIRALTAAGMVGLPDIHIEEVADEAIVNFLIKLGRIDQVRYALEVETFIPLLRRAIKDERITYWRKHGGYKDDRRTVPGLPQAHLEAANLDDPIADLVDGFGFVADAAKVFDAVGGPASLDGIILHLVYERGLPLRKIERLLVLAESADPVAARAETMDLLASDEEDASSVLELIGNCPSARAITYAGLKAIVHRIRVRVRRKLGVDDLDGFA